MTTPEATKTKKNTPQADVRIVGGKTQVKLRAYGRETIARFAELCQELETNAATHRLIAEAAKCAAMECDKLYSLFGVLDEVNA